MLATVVLVVARVVVRGSEQSKVEEGGCVMMEMVTTFE